MTVAIEKVGKGLSQLIRETKPGEEVILTENDLPVAKLVPLAVGTNSPKRKPGTAKFGSGKGQILYMAPDFDEPLEDFKEYME